MKTKFKKVPKHDFKLDCGDDPEVRQWLHDNGFKWYDGASVRSARIRDKNLIMSVKIKEVYSYIHDSLTFKERPEPLFNPYKKQLTDEQKLAKAKKLEKKAKALRDEVANKEVKQVLWVRFPNGCNEAYLESQWVEKGVGIKDSYLHGKVWHKVPTCTRLVKE